MWQANTHWRCAGHPRRGSTEGLLKKNPDGDGGFAATRSMELEVRGLTNTPYGEKTAERLVQRNDWTFHLVTRGEHRDSVASKCALVSSLESANLGDASTALENGPKFRRIAILE